MTDQVNKDVARVERWDRDVGDISKEVLFTHDDRQINLVRR